MAPAGGRPARGVSSSQHAPIVIRPQAARLAELRGSLAHGGTVWMLVGSLTAAAGAYLFQMLTARSLGSRDYAAVSVLWTIQYLLLSVVLYSVEAWTVRAVRHANGGLAALRSATRALTVQMTGLALVVGVACWLGRDRMFGAAPDLVAAAMLTVATYSLFVVSRAVLAARQRFKAYGVSTALESVVRLALVLPVLAFGGGTRAVGWVMPFGALGAAAYWFLARRSRPFPGTGADPADVDLADRPGRFLLSTVPANAASQLLLAGGPLVLVALGAPPEVTSTFFVTVTVARIPLVVAQGGLLSRLLPTFTDLARAGDVEGLTRLVRRLGLGGLLVSAAAAGFAAAVGPPLLALLYGGDFRPSAWLATASAGGVMLAATSSLLAQVLVACRRERALLLPWGIALAAAALAVAVTPGSEEGRVLAGFTVGQVVAFASLLMVATGQARRVRASS